MTSTARRPIPTAVVVVAALLAAAATWTLLRHGSAASAGLVDAAGPEQRTSVAARTSAEPTGARTALPGLTPAAGEPALPGLKNARPAPGTVARVAGPFDDRFRLSRLQYRNGQVSGILTVTSDVSDLLELQVLAGFYDVDGRLLHTGRFVQHSEVHDEAAGASPDGTEHFTIEAPRRTQARAVSAAVGVPVLVNE